MREERSVIEVFHILNLGSLQCVKTIVISPSFPVVGLYPFPFYNQENKSTKFPSGQLLFMKSKISIEKDSPECSGVTFSTET